MAYYIEKESFVASFLKTESVSGVLLFATALLAMIIANSPLLPLYEWLLNLPLAISVGNLEIDKPLLLWINDGLMMIFFLLVGLELKRELLEGELSNRRNIILPGIGAVGGMLLPALIYLYFNYDDPVAAKGWAIPAATDIAFALGVLALLGSRAPISLKIFLTSVAIFDDIGAVLIIAFFYTSKIYFSALLVVLACLFVLAFLNYRNVVARAPYILIGVVMWVAMLKSGVHATLAGVLLAMFIPLHSKKDTKHSPLRSMEHDLHGWVGFIVLPIFAFANAGISLKGVSIDNVFNDVPLGIMAGLFLGKQLGVFGFCWLFIKLKIAQLPEGMNIQSLYGISVLCGIGFTMSLFIGSLAFMGFDNLPFDERLGIVLGSLLSGIVGYIILRKSLVKPDKMSAAKVH